MRNEVHHIKMILWTKRPLTCLFHILLLVAFIVLGCSSTRNDEGFQIYIGPPWGPTHSKASWSPKGYWIVYCGSGYDTKHTPISYGLFVVADDGTRQELLDTRGGSPHWSFDGKSIIGNFGNGPSISVYDFTSRERIHLCNLPVSPIDISWHPDGTRLVVGWNSPDSLAGIWDWDINSNSGVKLFSNNVDIAVAREPSWNHTGDSIVLILRNEMGEWIATLRDPFESIDYLIEIDSLPRNGHFPGIFSSPSFSPDGRKIVFSTRQGSDEAKIWIYDLETSNVTKIVSGASYPCWSSDGIRVVYTKGKVPTSGSMDSVPGNGFLWIVDCITNEKWQLTYY